MHFKQPSKDTPDYLQINIESSESEEMRIAKIEWDAHLQKSEQDRIHVAADRMAASEDIFLFSFDLEKSHL